MWLIPPPAPVPSAGSRRSRGRSRGSSSLLLMVAAASIATGGGAVALSMVGNVSTPVAAAHHGVTPLTPHAHDRPTTWPRS